MTLYLLLRLLAMTRGKRIGGVADERERIRALWRQP
jgi:hypothetical protein